MIYLIRHGLDDENYIGGWSDVDLIKLGKEQVIDATNFIVDKKLIINKIISSDIKRAKSTTNIINEKLKLEIFYSKDLRELDKGDYTGVLKTDLLVEELEKIKKYDINSKYPNGEAMLDLYNRMKEYLEHLKNIDNVLLVTHRGVINMFYYILNDVNVDMDKEKFNVTYASIHEMDIKKKIIRRIY